MMLRDAPQSGLSRHAELNSEINVTPFVDVMLVLLIIFMVAAPMMTVGVAVDLPQASLPEIQAEEKPLDVFIKSDGSVYLGNQPVSAEQLPLQLSGFAQSMKEQRVRVRADAEVRYERIIAVMESLGAQGFSRIGLVATPKPAGRPQ